MLNMQVVFKSLLELKTDPKTLQQDLEKVDSLIKKTERLIPQLETELNNLQAQLAYVQFINRYFGVIPEAVEHILESQSGLRNWRDNTVQGMPEARVKDAKKRLAEARAFWGDLKNLKEEMEKRLPKVGVR